MKDREFRGGSEPPPPPPATNDVNDKTGLRRVPIKIAGVAMGSVEQLAVTGEGGPQSPWNDKNWRRSVTPSREVANANGATNGRGSNMAFRNNSSLMTSSPATAMPFGGGGCGGGGGSPFPAVCPKMPVPKRGRKSSSVSNIVAALESEISTWKRNNTAQRDYSGLLGWNTRSSGAPRSGNSEVEPAQVPRKAQTAKFEPRKEPKLERFFTFGEAALDTSSQRTRAAENGSNLNMLESSSIVRLCDGDGDESPESGSSSPVQRRRERKRNLSEVNGGEMGEITDESGGDEVGREGRLQSQAQSRRRRRRRLPFSSQRGDGQTAGRVIDDGRCRGESPAITTVTKTDTENSVGPFLDTFPPKEELANGNSVELLQQQQESGLFQSVSRVFENRQEGATIKVGAEKEKEEDGALISKTAVGEYFVPADLECAIQGSSLGEDETREEKAKAEEEIGACADQNLDNSKNASVALGQNFIVEMTSDNLAYTESNRTKEQSGEEHEISLHRCSNLLRRPVDFTTATTCHYSGITSRATTETAKNDASRSPSRSPVPSPSPIRKYLSEGSGNLMAREAPTFSSNCNGIRDIEGGARDAGPSCNKVTPGFEVKNRGNVAFQDAVVCTGATTACEATGARIAEGDTVPFRISDEMAKESSLTNLRVQKPGLKNNEGLDFQTEVITSTEEDVVEMGPENVKIHESVIPRIKITEKSSYYTGATSLENELSWAKDTKMKV